MEGKVKNSLKLPLPSSIIIDCTVTARYSLSSIIYEKNDVTAFWKTGAKPQLRKDENKDGK